MAEFLSVLSGLFDLVNHRREVWCRVQARSFRLRLRKNKFPAVTEQEGLGTRLGCSDTECLIYEMPLLARRAPEVLC